MLDFLKQATDPISHDVGIWTTWYDPDPLAIEAKLKKKDNKPKKEERSSEVKIEIDSSQFAKLPTRKKAGPDESQIIRHEGFRYPSSDDSSTSEGGMGHRRAVILKRAEQAEQREQRAEHREERQERLLELCDRNNIPRPPKPYSESRENLVTNKGDFYYRRSYAERFPRSTAGSSTDQRREKRNFRKINPPVSPGGIKRAARRIEEKAPHKLQKLIEFQKLFEWKDGERYLYAEHILKDLILKPQYYCPILRTKANGELIYEHVTEYNSIWRPRTKKGYEKDPLDYFSLDPVEVWQEDAWTFVRRMVGDYLAQKFFYEFMTTTWILIGVDKVPNYKIIKMP